MEINFVLGKNESYMPSSLGNRLINCCGQAGRQTKILQLAYYKINLKIMNLKKEVGIDQCHKS